MRWHLVVRLSLVLLVLIVGLAVVGYYSPAEAEVINLKFSTDSPGPPNPYEVGHEWFLKEVENRSNGRVKFERFYSQTLNPSREALFSVSKGVADMAQLVTGYWGGQLALSSVTTLPGMTKDMWAAMKASEELHQLKPLVDELTKVNMKYMAANGLSDYRILSTKPVRTLADLKGLRVRAMGEQADVLKELGAAPVGMTAPEVYQALQRGTIDAVAAPPVFIGVFKFYEVAKYYSMLGVGASAFLFPINLNTWNKLPKDIQKIFEEVAKESVDEMYRAYHIKGNLDILNNVMIPAGVRVIEASAADSAKIKEISSQTVWKNWAREKEAAGLPGNEILSKWVEYVAKWEPKNPLGKQ